MESPGSSLLVLTLAGKAWQCFEMQATDMNQSRASVYALKCDMCNCADSFETGALLLAREMELCHYIYFIHIHYILYIIYYILYIIYYILYIIYYILY